MSIFPLLNEMECFSVSTVALLSRVVMLSVLSCEMRGRGESCACTQIPVNFATPEAFQLAMYVFDFASIQRVKFLHSVLEVSSLIFPSDVIFAMIKLLILLMSGLFTSKYERVSAILVPVKGGKSYLANELKKYKVESKQTTHVIDLDAFAEAKIADLDKKVNVANWDLQVFPLVKELLKESLQKFPKDKFLVICSNVALVQYLKVEKEKQHAYLPGVDLYKSILTEVTDAVTTAAVTAATTPTAGSTPATGSDSTSDSATLAAQSTASKALADRIISSRDDFSKQYGDKAIRYASMEDLLEKVVAKFNFNLIL